IPKFSRARRQQPIMTTRTTRIATPTRKAPSHDPSAVRLASQLYSSHAPRELIKIWRQKLTRRRKWDASFVESAVDVVVDRTRRDLRRSSKGVIGQVDPPLKRPAYQFPYNTVTQTNIEHVIDRGFLGSYLNHARPLTTLLEGVLYKDNRKNKGRGKRLHDDEDRNGNKDHNEHEHKDDGKDMTEDEESEVEGDVEEEEDIEKEDAKEEEDVGMMDFVDIVESQKVVRLAQPVGADSDAEEEDAVKVEEKNKSDAPARRRPHRNPVSVRGCIAAMLLFMTSQKCNAFQTVMGVFLHCTGCPTRVLDVLSSLGLSVSDDQVRKALGNMTKDAMDQVKKAVLENDWFVVYDNINIALKHHHQRINKLDTFENGTAATVILIHPEEDREKAGHDEKAEHGETSEHDERDPDNENVLDDENGSSNASNTDDESDTDDESSAGDE
ncbi:hypothetical protein BGZ97_009537, partial [Linnemannia gamsii]